MQIMLRPQRPPLVDASEMTRFHDDGFINFLAKITPDNMREYTRELQRCKMHSIHSLCVPLEVKGSNHRTHLLCLGNDDLCRQHLQ